MPLITTKGQALRRVFFIINEDFSPMLGGGVKSSSYPANDGSAENARNYWRRVI